MRMIMRWLAAPRGRDMRDGDPYLEALGRQLLLLRSGQAPRRPAFPRATDA